jgi:uncharacterized membrane protein YccC
MRADAVSVLGRILPLAAAVGRGVRTLGLVGLGATVAIALVILVRWTPGDGEDWAGFGVLCVLLAVPVAVLFAFSLVLGEVVELPDKLRSYAGTTREHVSELSAIAHDAQRRERPAWRRLPGARGGSRRLYARPGACSRRMRRSFRSSACLSSSRRSSQRSSCRSWS